MLKKTLITWAFWTCCAVFQLTYSLRNWLRHQKKIFHFQYNKHAQKKGNTVTNNITYLYIYSYRVTFVLLLLHCYRLMFSSKKKQAYPKLTQQDTMKLRGLLGYQKTSLRCWLATMLPTFCAWFFPRVANGWK